MACKRGRSGSSELPSRQCQLCARAGCSVTCTGCEAVSYCADRHRTLDSQAHSSDCDRMKSFKGREAEMRWFPFRWAEMSTNDIDDGNLDRCMLLTMLGVHEHPLWRGVCSCRHADEATESISLGAWRAVMPMPNVARPVPQHVLTWPDYCSARGLDLSAATPLVLDCALTLHYVLQRLADAEAVPRLVNGGDKCVLRVHLLGAERELDALCSFSELSWLYWQAAELHLHLIGPEVPASRDGEVVHFEPPCTAPSDEPTAGCTVRIVLHSGLYHAESVQRRLAELGAAHAHVRASAACRRACVLLACDCQRIAVGS